MGDPILALVVLRVDRYALEVGDADTLMLQLGMHKAVSGVDIGGLPTVEIVIASRVALIWCIIQAMSVSNGVALIYLLACRALWCWVR